MTSNPTDGPLDPFNHDDELSDVCPSWCLDQHLADHGLQHMSTPVAFTSDNGETVTLGLVRDVTGPHVGADRVEVAMLALTDLPDAGHSAAYEPYEPYEPVVHLDIPPGHSDAVQAALAVLVAVLRRPEANDVRAGGRSA